MTDERKQAKVTDAEIEVAAIAIASIYNETKQDRQRRDGMVSITYELACGMALEWARVALEAAASIRPAQPEQASKEEIIKALIDVQIMRENRQNPGCACVGPLEGYQLCPCSMNRIEEDADALLPRFSLSKETTS